MSAVPAKAMVRQPAGTKIEGTVKRILYQNAKNNRCILLVQSQDIPDFAKSRKFPNTCIVLGFFPRLATGLSFEFAGKWQKSSRYNNWQFEASSHQELLPDTEQATIDYLASGLFPGIGPKTAERIVTAFGTETLKIIKEQPERLVEVKGISVKKVQAITDSYQKSMHLEDLMLKLKSYFLSNKQIIQISQKYGEKALEKIWENPYCLCDDFEGIGFLTADGIARDCKFAPNDDYRIRTAVLYSLREQTYSQGHVYLPYQILAQKTRETLEKGKIQGDVDKNDIVRVIMDMIQNKELVMENDSAIYLPFYHTCEIRAAQKLRALIQTQPRKFSIDLNKLIQQMEKKQKIRFAKQQKEAFLTLPKSNVIVITGGPGTGKTTIVKGIIDIYRANFPGCRVILAAPTGRAAKRMEEATKIPAKTIHRLLEFRPSGDKIVCGKDEHNPIEADVIIIDESSMIDVALLATFLKAVKPTTSLILVGDIDQLPSVGAGSVLKDIIECQKVPVVYLNEIFRQGETSNIVINARKVNSGDADLQLGEDFIFVKETDITAIARLVKQHYLVEIHRQGMPNLQELQIITPLRRKTETGVEQLNALLQETVNPKNPKKAELRYGSHTFRRYDKVMQYRNNYEKDIYNGDMGIIESVSAESNILLVRMESGLVEFTKDDLDELQLAYAMTIHKSQGCEYETVIIPLCMEHKRMLQRNLIYTAITRAKSKVILIGDPEALAYAVSNHCVNERFSKLAKRI